MAGGASVFELFPELATLRGKVPEEIVDREIRPKADRFARISAVARQRIPTARLADVLPAEVETGRVVLERFLGQWGNISVEEVCKLALICSWQKPRAIFEFGTYTGMTTLQLALNTPADCIIHTLDIAPDSAEARALDVGEIDSYLVQKTGAFRFPVGEYFLQHPLAGKIRQLLGNSLTFDFSAYAGAIDLVFVDAGHTLQCARSDTENALRMISRGGVILWHDYMQLLHPGVTECLLEYVDRGLKIYQLRGTHLALHYHQ